MILAVAQKFPVIAADFPVIRKAGIAKTLIFMT
jgi:hypothetical protein